MINGPVICCHNMMVSKARVVWISGKSGRIGKGRTKVGWNLGTSLWLLIYYTSSASKSEIGQK